VQNAAIKIVSAAAFAAFQQRLCLAKRTAIFSLLTIKPLIDRSEILEPPDLHQAVAILTFDQRMFDDDCDCAGSQVFLIKVGSTFSLCTRR
jgi:hypothetical protein